MPMTSEDKQQIYAFFKTFFLTEPTEEFVKRLQQDEVFKEVGDESLALIKEDYDQLFMGPQKHIALNESIYREKTPQFWGEAAVKSNRLLQELGLSLDENWSLMPDHIIVEFEILQKLAERESEALAENDHETAQKCQTVARNFFLDHIAMWVPMVCDTIVQQASTRFYKEMAQFMKDFIHLEQKEFSGYAA